VSALWQKIWHDLWAHKARTMLAVLSIAAGVIAVGTIVGMVDQLLRGMDRAHRAASPSHFNIILRGSVDANDVEALRDTPGVAGIEAVNQLAVRYRTDPAQPWQQGNLVMRRDYGAQTYDTLALVEGAWPGDDTLGVERLSGQFFGLGIGDSVTFDLGDEERSFPIDGVVRHPFVQPPAFGGVAHFFVDGETLEAFGIPEGRFVQLLVRTDEPWSRERAEQIAGDLRARLGDANVPVAVTIYQDPERHWGRSYVEGSTLVLQTMAVVAALLSVVLVMSILSALITQQTDQIGVLKAIGASRGTIVGAYLPGVFVIGLAALLIGLPIGMLGAFAATRAFLNLFNIDYGTFQFSPRAVALQLAAGLLIPLLAGLGPVLRGARITVREALASYGLGSDFGSSRLDRAVEAAGARFLPTAYAAALGNMFRRKGRLLLTLLVLTTAGTAFLMIMTLFSSVNRTLDTDSAQRRYDLQIGLQRAQSNAALDRALEGVPGIAQQERWVSYNATLLRGDERLQDSAGLGVQLIGLPPASDFFAPILLDGRWLAPDDGRAIVISQATAEKNDLRVGDTVGLDLGGLGSDEWQIVGLYRVVVSNNFVTEGFYAPLAAVEDATGRDGEASRLLVRAADPSLAGVTALADSLRAALEDDDIDVDLYTTAITQREREFTLNQFGAVLQTLLGLASLLATVGGMGLAGALSISVMERTREIGVLRAIGARSRTIVGLFVMEGVLQSLLSWLLALPLALLLAPPLARALGQRMLGLDLDYAFNGAAVLVWLGVAVGIGVCAALQPAVGAARMNLRATLSYT
jgi:putative ABC transport system permease protein